MGDKLTPKERILVFDRDEKVAEQARENPPSRVQAAAAQYLIDGREFEAAELLLSAELELAWDVEFDFGEKFPFAAPRFIGPRFVYDAITEGTPAAKQIEKALRAVLPAMGGMTARLEEIHIDPDWRDRMLQIARGADISNQGRRIEDGPRFAWNNLYFRSKAERAIAEALDRARVCFFPNCLGRLDVAGERRNREPDFLVCLAGKWGILEVDGEVFHTRAAEDHERDRAFKAAGVKTVERFDAERCRTDPDGVVKSFLQLLKNQ